MGCSWWPLGEWHTRTVPSWGAHEFLLLAQNKESLSTGNLRCGSTLLLICKYFFWKCKSRTSMLCDPQTQQTHFWKHLPGMSQGAVERNQISSLVGWSVELMLKLQWQRVTEQGQSTLGLWLWVPIHEYVVQCHLHCQRDGKRVVRLPIMGWRSYLMQLFKFLNENTVTFYKTSTYLQRFMKQSRTLNWKETACLSTHICAWLPQR